MSGRFLITGLPRSRTAWWSVVTSTPVSVCTHEPLKHTACFADLAAFWDRPVDFVGVADSGLVSQLARILDEIAPRTLIVLRDPAEVFASLERYFGRPIDGGMLPKLKAQRDMLDRFVGHPLVMAVTFDALNDERTVAACFDWLLPDSGMCQRQDLLRMNIQADPAKALADMARPHNLWYLS